MGLEGVPEKKKLLPQKSGPAWRQKEKEVEAPVVLPRWARSPPNIESSANRRNMAVQSAASTSEAEGRWAALRLVVRSTPESPARLAHSGG